MTRARLKPHRRQCWVIPPKANSAFVAAMEDVLAVYTRPHDPERVLVCLDETSKQLIAETRLPIPMKPGQAARIDYEYERNGTANLFMLFAPLEGWRHIKVTDRHIAIDYAHVLKDFIEIGQGFLAGLGSGRVQRQLHARNPKTQPPRITTGPILLTGLAVCASCGGGMTLRTGTSKGGRVYRYYTCTTCVCKGKTACKGRSIPMEKLDTLVAEHLMERLFKPERVAAILTSLSSRRAEKAATLNNRLMALQREMADADDKLKRLYRLIEDGVTDSDEVLKDRLNELKVDRDRAKAALERAKEHSAPQAHIDPALIEHFGRTLCENFRNGSLPFRKAYLQSLIDVVEIDDRQIRIKGRKELLEKAVLASRNGQSWCSQTSTRWRARRDFELLTPRFVVWGFFFHGLR